MLSIMLIVLDQRGNPQVNTLRAKLAEGLLPVVSVLSKPVETVSGATNWVQGIFSAHAENQLLREENIRLKQWMTSATQLQAQNNTLQKLLNVPAPEATHFITTRAVADLRGPFGQAMLIGAGKEQQVQLHQPVVGPEGLLGRVVEVNANNARVLLISDINSRLPVAGNQSKMRSILVGKGVRAPQLQFIEGRNPFVAGEWLVTVATENIPAGLPVAQITSVKDGVPKISVLQNDTTLDYLRVIQYSPISK